MKEKQKMIELFDTTLRDGTQGESVNLSVDDKLRIAVKLDEFRINIIAVSYTHLTLPTICSV